MLWLEGVVRWAFWEPCPESEFYGYFKITAMHGCLICANVWRGER